VIAYEVAETPGIKGGAVPVLTVHRIS
jgi:hypothetical protein